MAESEAKEGIPLRTFEFTDETEAVILPKDGETEEQTVARELATLRQVGGWGYCPPPLCARFVSSAVHMYAWIRVGWA